MPEKVPEMAGLQGVEEENSEYTGDFR
jgi:hypothetical protein